MTRARYLIGIDLGTSNSALAYVDTLAADSYSQILEIKQLESLGVEGESKVLPSFLYFGTEQESENLSLKCSLKGAEQSARYAVGRFALQQTAYLPERVVSSAKSWLCHGGVAREENILPWGSSDIPPEERLSPVAVSAVFLRHLADCWNDVMAEHHEEYRFENQEISITVPASFDEAALQLTQQAARAAGYPERIHLLEEPQAAFYRWLEAHDLERELFSVKPGLAENGARILVCDIGGGTSDFSLFDVRKSPESEDRVITAQTSQDRGDDSIAVERIAVSDHILLGGDNIDLAIAHQLEASLLQGTDSERSLSSRQMNYLLHAARGLKEKALEQGGGEDEVFHVSIPGEGSSLLASSLSASVSRNALTEAILEGFFPFCGRGERPQRKALGLQEWGLPFASDSAVSKHLAAFLDGRSIDAVLYNGGTLKPCFLVERLQELITSWQDGSEPIRLDNEHLELAVARGAAHYGKVLRKQAMRIAGGYARSLYLEVESDQSDQRSQLVCVLPQGFEANRPVLLEAPEFKLLLNQPIRFQMYHSTHRASDRPGDVISVGDDDFHPLPLVQTVLSHPQGIDLPKDGLLRVSLEISLSEVGILQLYLVHCKDESELARWQLDFNLRGDALEAGGGETEGGRAAEIGVPLEALRKAEQCLNVLYGKGKGSEAKAKVSPKKLVKDLEEIIGAERSEWNTALLRALWPGLKKGITRRGRSLAHEMTWLYLAGFLLRPGYGVELDRWRIKELWRVFELGLSFPKENSSLAQWWIMWRRVAGGLDSAEQEKLYSKIRSQMNKKGSDDPEMLRLAGSLERISFEKKAQLANMIVKRISGRKTSGVEHYIWALGRLSSRVPLYASAHQVIPVDFVASWFEKLSDLDWTRGDFQHLNSAFAQACRITGDRNRDLPLELRREVRKKLRTSGATAQQLRFVEELVPLEYSDQVQLFGEELPSGLRLA